MNLGIYFDEFPDAFSLPDGPPEISYPFRGDSIPGVYDIFVFAPTQGKYLSIPLGTDVNIQTTEANATAFIIEQTFLVRASTYTPLPLNTVYDAANWSLGWNGPVDLGTAGLVTEGRLEMMEGGLGRVRRTFANVPPSRNSYESFTFQFPGLTIVNSRQPVSLTGSSRLQYDYFLLKPGAAQPYIYPPFIVYQRDANAVLLSLIADPPFILDAVAGSAGPPVIPAEPATVPPLHSSAGGAGYLAMIGTNEIVVEASCLRPWMGNIYERVTRFMVAF